MPYFRGIEISIHASLEARQVTEYPHPDGSSVRLLRATALPVTCDATTGAGRATQPNAPSTAEDIDPTRLKKVNPRISVYIPSLPGEQFWLRYLISQSPPPSRCIFFKMTMNGRHISSWGINTNTHSTGLVVRALYQPEDKWGDACGYNDAGYPGIETRYFHFMPGLDKKSVAEDGGIIEVQVFRCKGRKRIALELDAYRNQERYGITSPSGGLVDNPEDATYYNYYLIDAKDSPYATFCFHYRSMKYLKQLNLVPQLGLDMSPPCRNSLDTRRERSSTKSRSQSISPHARRFTFDTMTLESRVFDDNLGVIDGDEVARAETNAQEEYFLKSPPELSPSSLRGVATKASSRTPEPELSCEVQQRPLPEIPTVQTRPTSASSLRSNCPSLTPSLRLYVESDDFENEDIRLSTAQPMLISSESMQALELVDTGADEGTSFSDYASSPGSTEASNSPQLPSPRGYIPTTGSVLERHLTQYDSPVAGSSPSQTQKMASSKTGGTLDSNRIEPRTVALNLSEAEWLRHSPSPLQRKDKLEERLWSPQPGPCIDDTVRTSNSGGQRHARDVEHHTEAIDQAPIGNWI
ncbi:hypothetical protein F4859DRAFT_40755 [Xylaria cf. heliscus]|nr:hypothetical protein F4859DRAFT_40755 [Xylaria cf. heliscus]